MLTSYHKNVEGELMVLSIIRTVSGYYSLWQALIYILILCIFCFPIAYADENDEQTSLDYLIGLDILDLGEVETGLEDVFDIFNGVMEMRQQQVVSATGIKQPSHRAAAVTTVITAQDIEAMGATHLDEVLETVAGLHVSHAPFFYNAAYTIRGIKNNTNSRVLVTVNGQPIKSAFSGNSEYIARFFPINNIARIEIIRGPGSALHGADAFAGVINIITKSTADIEGTEAGTRIGSFDTQELWLLHGKQYHGFNIAYSLQYFHTDGFKETIVSDLQTEIDEQLSLFNLPPASLAPGPANVKERYLSSHIDVSKGAWRLRTGYQGRRDVGAGAGSAFSLDPLGNSESDRIDFDLSHETQLAQYWNIKTRLNYVNTQDASFLQASPPNSFLLDRTFLPEGLLSESRFSEHQARLDIAGFYGGFRNHLLHMGAGYSYEKLYDVETFNNLDATGQPLPPSSALTATAPFIPEEHRNNWHLYIQDTWAFADDWELTAGVRYDHYSDFGGATNPRLALVWYTLPNDVLTTKLLYGRAFRAPSFRELYIQSAELVGNPNLSAETIDTFELAFDYSLTKRLQFALNLFTYEISDIIDIPVQASQTTVTNQTAKQEGYGFEFEARWKMHKRASLLFNYAYAKNEDKGTDADVGLYPQQQAYLRTDWSVLPDWYLNTQVFWIADRARAANDNRAEVEDYWTVDFTLRHRPQVIRSGDWNLALGIRNVFDEAVFEPTEYQPANDLPMAKRHLFFEVRYKF